MIVSERWQLIAMLIVTAIFLQACGTTSTPSARIQLAPLPAQISEPCPPLDQIPDQSIPALATADADAALAYRECQAKHYRAVEAYEAARKASR